MLGHGVASGGFLRSSFCHCKVFCHNIVFLPFCVDFFTLQPSLGSLKTELTKECVFFSLYSLLWIVLRQNLPGNAFFVTIQPSLVIVTQNLLRNTFFGLAWEDTISVVARQDLCCGKTRCVLWQDKISVVARQDLSCGKT